MVQVRLATAADAPALLAVYEPYVRDTAITFETTVPTREAFGERVASIVDDYPYLVVEDAGTVVGYAYAHRFGERGAYGWNAELSVYFAPTHRGRGWGSVLFWALIDLLSQQGVRNAYSLVTMPNEPSRRLHEKLGFELVGIQCQAGYKQGRWHDVAWLRKAIGSFEGAPAPRIPFACLDADRVEEVLEAATAAMNAARFGAAADGEVRS